VAMSGSVNDAEFAARRERRTAEARSLLAAAKDTRRHVDDSKRELEALLAQIEPPQAVMIETGPDSRISAIMIDGERRRGLTPDQLRSQFATAFATVPYRDPSDARVWQEALQVDAFDVASLVTQLQRHAHAGERVVESSDGRLGLRLRGSRPVGIESDDGWLSSRHSEDLAEEVLALIREAEGT
jgi:hypothetical protein